VLGPGGRGGRGATIRHKRNDTHHNQAKHSIQNYANNVRHTTQCIQSKYSYNYNKYNTTTTPSPLNLTKTVLNLFYTLTTISDKKCIAGDIATYCHLDLVPLQGMWNAGINL
jgi:hypothetical protein